MPGRIIAVSSTVHSLNHEHNLNARLLHQRTRRLDSKPAATLLLSQHKQPLSGDVRRRREICIDIRSGGEDYLYVALVDYGIAVFVKKQNLKRQATRVGLV